MPIAAAARETRCGEQFLGLTQRPRQRVSRVVAGDVFRYQDGRRCWRTLTAVNLALIEDRAARLRQAAAQLLEICTSDGHRHGDPDPRRPWVAAAPRARPT